MKEQLSQLNVPLEAVAEYLQVPYSHGEPRRKRESLRDVLQDIRDTLLECKAELKRLNRK